MLKHYKHNLAPLIVSLLFLVLTSLLYLEKIQFGQALLQRLNATSYDLRLRTTTGTPIGFSPIFIIDIDENSLEQEGRWPWSRKKLALLIDKLHAAGTAVITLDITLAEAERNPVDAVSHALTQHNPELSSALKSIRTQLDADQQLAITLRNKNVILGYLFNQTSTVSKGEIKPTLIQNNAPIKKLSSFIMQGYSANLPLLSQSATQNGFFTIIPDDDGIVRKAALILEYNQQLYTSLAIETVKLYLGANTEYTILKSKQISDAYTITDVTVAGQKIPTDANGRIRIPYIGATHTFPYISASDVLHNKKLPDLTDSIVIIGTSAQALADLSTTPLASRFPGVEIQANLIHALLNPDTIPYAPDWNDGAIMTLLVVLSFIMLVLYPLLRPMSLIIIGFCLLGSVISFNLWLWIVAKIDLDIILPALHIILTSSLFIFHRVIREHHERQRLHGMFGQYVPADHIDRLLETNKAVNMDGERREMSVLFSDIRNFTSISEGLTTHQLKQFLNHYLTPITEIIFKQHGTIDKYIGDLVMAFWGAPLDDPHHAENAVLAALKMRSKTASMQDELQRLGITQVVKAGIGIHTGEMNVGDMGSRYRRAYTVLGDAVNLGSRLESLTKQYGILILTSKETMQHCPSISFRLVDYVRVKGRHEPVQIYEPICLTNTLLSKQKQQINAHHDALEAYLTGDWQQAYQHFTELVERYNDPLHQTYLQRMQQMKLTPPDDWDGIFTHTNK
ncbi:MAG: adenylate/guanylate cyclase domain-containing protein [Cocleimonas sp.]|nr:adenylate/guanylate cyclase domain-containing protein [Cocleimonas sp.]